MNSDWLKYTCKSGQTLFIYNKVTGEHRWAAKHSNDSMQDHIDNGEPMHPKEYCDTSTQTDDFGCCNGCTSMYVETNLDLLANSVVAVSMNGLDEITSSENEVKNTPNNGCSVQVASFSHSNHSTTLESHSQHLNKRKRLININVTNGKHTTAVEKHSVSDIHAENASSSPGYTENLLSICQETQKHVNENSVETSSVIDKESNTSVVTIEPSHPSGINPIQSDQSFKGTPIYMKTIEGNSQRISIDEQEHVLNTSIALDGKSHSNDNVDMNMPIITSVSSIRASNGDLHTQTNSQEINVNGNNHLLDEGIIADDNTMNGNIRLPIITSVSSNQASEGALPNSCSKDVGTSSPVRQVSRRKRFLFTNYIPKGKRLVKVNNKDSVSEGQASKASPPPSSSTHLETNCQEKTVKDANCIKKVNVEVKIHDNNLKDAFISPQVSSGLPPSLSKSVGNERSNDSPQVVIANVFSYATGKIYTACQDVQKDQHLVATLATSVKEKSPVENCSSNVDKQLEPKVPETSTQSSEDQPSLPSSQEDINPDREGELSLGEHHTLIAQQLKCGNCNRDFNSRAHLDEHLKTYKGERPFKCCYCNQTFSDNGDLLVHLRTHMTAKPYKCSHCDKAFRHNSSLSVHLKLHTGEKGYKCPSCDKTFRQKIHLRNHLRVHTTELQFKCSDCDKKFKSNSELVVHLLSHSGIKPHKCRYCDRLFSQECHLKSHEQAHCKRKTDKCPHCNKVFKFGSSLTLHLRTHTGERPYKCSQCDLTFRQKQHLIVHVRRHTGEKPFVCQHCGKAFRHDTGLRSHLLIHPESDYSKAQKEMYTDDQLKKKE